MVYRFFFKKKPIDDKKNIGFRVWGLGFGVQGLGFGVFGFGVFGFGVLGVKD